MIPTPRFVVVGGGIVGLTPAGTGVRAQAVTPGGGLVDDFLFVNQGHGPGSVVHVLNAPSPAATAALPLGREILRRLTGDHPRESTHSRARVGTSRCTS